MISTSFLAWLLGQPRDAEGNFSDKHLSGLNEVIMQQVFGHPGALDALYTIMAHPSMVVRKHSCIWGLSTSKYSEQLKNRHGTNMCDYYQAWIVWVVDQLRLCCIQGYHRTVAFGLLLRMILKVAWPAFDSWLSCRSVVLSNSSLDFIIHKLSLLVSMSSSSWTRSSSVPPCLTSMWSMLWKLWMEDSEIGPSHSCLALQAHLRHTLGAS